MEDITIRDLYNWAKDHGYLDYKIRIKYRDDGGEYFGADNGFSDWGISFQCKVASRR
jgi:hypothetical protein